LFDFLCIFIGDKASLHDEDRFPLEELHHTKLPSNMHATHSIHQAANSEPRKMANPPAARSPLLRSEGRRLAGPLRLASLLQWILIFDEGLNYSISADG
jgi:hypothetical protein